MEHRRTGMRSLLLVLLLVGLTACESDQQPPIGRPDQGPARFEFVSSWEPSIDARDYVTVVEYTFTLRNVGGRASAPACEVLLRDAPLDGWSEGPEIGVESNGRVTGEALLPTTTDPHDVVPRLEPRCGEATGHESMAGVPKRFFAMEGDQAYFELRRSGFQILFGPDISTSERQNIRGHLTHPEVVLTQLKRQRGTPIITIIDVDCVGREATLC